MKERKCRKCKMTYQGLKTTCPYCHKNTGLGIANKLMCFIGYITVIVIACYLIYDIISSIVIASVISSIFTPLILFPTISLLAVIAFIVFILWLIFR